MGSLKQQLQKCTHFCACVQDWPGTVMEVVMPKSTNTTILEVVVDNLVG